VLESGVLRVCDRSRLPLAARRPWPLGPRGGSPPCPHDGGPSPLPAALRHRPLRPDTGVLAWPV